MALSKMGEDLANKLKTISQDEDFIIGILSNIKSDAERGKMIDFIDIAKRRGDELTTDDLVMLSLILAKENNDNKQSSRR